jgi:hypothetical protein
VIAYIYIVVDAVGALFFQIRLMQVLAVGQQLEPRALADYVVGLVFFQFMLIQAITIAARAADAGAAHRA